MALTLPQSHVRAIDQLRTRISNLSTSIGLLRGQLESSDPLPPWHTLQAATTTLGQNMEDLADALSQQRQLFASMHSYPSSDFPGVTQEMLLQQLLRKKLDPKAEDWLEDNMKPVGQAASIGDGQREAQGGVLEDDEMLELWSWAKESQASVLERLAEEGAWDDDFTIEEREKGIENVVTGLKRNLDTGEEDADEDKMDDEPEPKENAPAQVPPAVSLDSLLRLASGQDVPGLKA